MAKSAINSPNSASTNSFGLGTLDSLYNDLAVAFDTAYNMYNIDAVAKSNPTPAQSFNDSYYLLDDIHKFQVQLYQELRYQVARQDIHDQMFASATNDMASMSGASTIDTPNLNSSVLSVLDHADYHFPEMPEMPYVPEVPELNLSVPDLMEVPAPKKRKVGRPSNPPPPAKDPPVKKHTRKHILARSRSGCWICRIKHLKCDESRPVCIKCTKFGIQCDYSPHRPEYVSNMEMRRQKLDAITTKKRRTVPPNDA